jgi:hypothetical protein
MWKIVVRDRVDSVKNYILLSNGDARATTSIIGENGRYVNVAESHPFGRHILCRAFVQNTWVFWNV